MLLKIIGVLIPILVFVPISFYAQILLPYPYGLVLVIISMILLGVFGAVLWKYDNKLKSRKTNSDNSINVLKERYAKGEITKEEYDKIKKDLD